MNISNKGKRNKEENAVLKYKNIMYVPCGNRLDGFLFAFFSSLTVLLVVRLWK